MRDSAQPAMRAARPRVEDLTGCVNRHASIVQGVFPGKFHRREPLIPVVDRFGSFWVPDQRIIAPPAPVLQFVKLHFDLDAFIAALNHGFLILRRTARTRRRQLLLSYGE